MHHELLSSFLARTDAPVTKTSDPTPVAKATASLSATARAIVAASPSPVTKDAPAAPVAPAAPQTGPRYIERAPATAPAAPGSVEAVFQSAVRQVPEPDGGWDPAAAFDEARAKREDGRYGVPITGHSS